MTAKDAATISQDLTGPAGDPIFANFIEGVRSRRWQDLKADILEGHMSASLCHLGNISYKTGRKLVFNPNAEKFVNDKDADTYLKRIYRPHYIVPDKV